MITRIKKRVRSILNSLRNGSKKNKADRLFKIQGGYLIPKETHVLFPSDKGEEIIFQGIRVSTSRVVKNAAYQLNGVIYISKNWIKKGFSVQDFAHEYGHYLQQKELGLFKYLVKIAFPSMFSLAAKPKKHFQRPFERDATNKGNEYLKRYL